MILRGYKISDELKDHFSSYGNVVEHQIMLDHSTGRSRGFGFVTFESEDSVERVISEGRMRDLGGKQVRFLNLFCCRLMFHLKAKLNKKLKDLEMFIIHALLD
jgi:RNA recognition motif-containing protein